MTVNQRPAVAKKPNHSSWKRYLLASWRDTRVLLRQFRIPLLLFAASILVGGFLFDRLNGDQVLNVSELTINPQSVLAGQKIGDLERSLDLSVIAHRRGAQVDLHPKADITIQPGDQICVFASLKVLNRLGHMNLADQQVGDSANGQTEKT